MTYRVGNHQPQNLYRGDQYIGVCFDPADTALIAAAMEGHLLTAKAGPGEDACGKTHPDRPYACQRRARHDVCVSWQSGNGSDAWVVDYDDLVSQIEQLRTERAERNTPDVDHTNGAREALAHVADRIADAAATTSSDFITLRAVRLILEGVAAELGVDEEAPTRPLSASVAAEQPSAGGNGRPGGAAAISGRCGKCGSFLAPCLEACGSLAQCGELWCAGCAPEGWTREPERKADQAYTCPDHPGPLDDPTGHACRLRPARDERTTP